MRGISFTKAIATGNDFVIIRNNNFNKRYLAKLAKLICDRKYGVGADGLLVAEKSKIADLKMRIFNPDGSEAEMCGNGIRCFLLWGYKNGILKRTSRIQTLAGIIEGEIKRDSFIEIKLSASFEYKEGVAVGFEGRIYRGDYINTGVPHFVVEVKGLDNVEVNRVGRFIRFHRLFQPQGTNVDFIEFKGDKLYVRTYERGVEAETLACGTGAVASALVFGKKRNLSKVNVMTRSGEELRVSFSFKDGKYRDVFLEGKAEILFEGKFYLKKGAFMGG